ncbi:MAG: glutathione ABC transporter permease [delta proteobacterium ML8_F1]|nr:MAG: glutathione ABC transporter permease [delta proteobacterium ML8_F1]
MLKYIIKRILVALPVIFGISVIAFFLIRLVPGDTITALLGANYNEQQALILRAKYGLDQPLPVQYLIWLKNVLSGDFGVSFFTNEPVVKIIMERLPVTLELMLISLLYSIFIAIPLGTIAALKRNSATDYGASVFGLLGVSIPNFWLGILLIAYFSLHLRWLPSGGFVSFWVDPAENIRHMIMPSIALGTAVGAVIMRMTRSSMLEVLGQDYIKMADAKGVTNKRLIFNHALKNSFVPIVTVLGIQMGYLLGGSVVIEKIFALPGIGQLSLQAITNRDYALLQGCILLIATGFVVINLIVDIIYGFLDPKIRY